MWYVCQITPINQASHNLSEPLRRLKIIQRHFVPGTWCHTMSDAGTYPGVGALGASQKRRQKKKKKKEKERGEREKGERKRKKKKWQKR